MPVRCRVLVPCLVVFAFLIFPVVARGQQPGGSSVSTSSGTMQPMCVSGCNSYSVDVSPDGAERTLAPLTGGHTAGFTVHNLGTAADEFGISCGKTSPVTSCSVLVDDVLLDPGETITVTVTYAVGDPGTGSLTLTADGLHSSDPGSYVIHVPTPPALSLVSPGSGASVAVHNRQPVIRALFTPGTGDVLDTTQTVLTWRGDTVTSLAHHNGGLLEWEVDSTHWLTAGLAGHADADTAVLSLRACGSVGGCTTVTRTVILSDATPILGFSGMPLGNLNGGYTAGFGPGLAVAGAEVTPGSAPGAGPRWAWHGAWDWSTPPGRATPGRS